MEYNTPYACTKGFFERVCRRLLEEDKVEANTQIQRGDDDDVDNPKAWNYSITHSILPSRERRLFQRRRRVPMLCHI